MGGRGAHGVGGEARLNKPCGIAFYPDGSLILSDTYNHCLRRVSPQGEVSTFAGSGVGVGGGRGAHKVDAVERDLDSLEERFVTLAETLWSGDLGQAHRVSASLLTAAISFERYAIDELDAARSQFMCCELRRARPAAFGGHGVALGAIAAAVLLAAYALLRK